MFSVTTKDRSLDERPKEPLPEGFGLTIARFRQLDSPKWEGRVMGVSSLALFLVIAALTYENSKSVIGAVAFALLYPPFWFGYIVIAVVPSSISSAIWRRVQKDYKQYLEYKKSQSDYKVRLADWFRTQLFWWRNLGGREFEIELAQLLTKRGYQVKWTGKAGDGGIDLALWKDGRNVIVQCKAHGRPIGPAPVRDLFGTMIDRNASEAWLVSSFGFSKAARNFANGKRIQLFSIEDLLRINDPS